MFIVTQCNGTMVGDIHFFFFFMPVIHIANATRADESEYKILFFLAMTMSTQ